MEVGGIAPLFLTSAIVGGVWSALRPGLFNPGKIAPDMNWTGGWVDPSP
jgi:hypothetical protein